MSKWDWPTKVLVVISIVLLAASGVMNETKLVSENPWLFWPGFVCLCLALFFAYRDSRKR